MLKEVAEKVAIRRGIMIGDARHVSVKDRRRNRVPFKVAGRAHCAQHPPQSFENQLVNKAPAVVAHVEDDALLTNLGKVLLDELVQSFVAHIREIDIANASATGRVYLLAVRLDHVQLAQIE